jgi:hypothetical protein
VARHRRRVLGSTRLAKESHVPTGDTSGSVRSLELRGTVIVASCASHPSRLARRHRPQSSLLYSVLYGGNTGCQELLRGMHDYQS